MRKMQFRKSCSHEFRLKDLQLTGIPELPEPKAKDYKAWQQYYSEIYKHDSHTKRVSLNCRKCGEIFYAHCGLDIISKGKIARD